MADDVKAPTVAEAMGRVLADIPAVGKNSQAPSNMGGYHFRGIEDVLAAVKPALGRHGVFLTPHTLERIPSERTVSGNKIMYVVDLWVEWTFRGPAGDSITADAWGQGTDMGDKATQKAYTSAFKTMLSETFCIGDSATDSEAHSVPEAERQPEDPDAGWKAIGWPNEATYEEWVSSRVTYIKELDEGDRAAVKEWTDAHGLSFRKAIPHDLADSLDLYLKEIGEKPNPAPEVETPEPPSEPTPEPQVEVEGSVCDAPDCTEPPGEDGFCARHKAF